MNEIVNAKREEIIYDRKYRAYFETLNWERERAEAAEQKAEQEKLEHIKALKAIGIAIEQLVQIFGMTRAEIEAM